MSGPKEARPRVRPVNPGPWLGGDITPEQLERIRVGLDHLAKGGNDLALLVLRVFDRAPDDTTRRKIAAGAFAQAASLQITVDAAMRSDIAPAVMRARLAMQRSQEKAARAAASTVSNPTPKGDA